jgi:catechol 2,3-dioxygenase-like lactoylglutathione lyase family enzyme
MRDVRFVKTTIILPVRDIYDTVAWYQRALGLETRYIHGSGRRGEERNYANYAIMGRDAVEVHFIMDESRDGTGNGHEGWTVPGNGYLGLTVTDADALHAAVMAAGIAVDGPVRNMNWPARGFDLRDPDGNSIHIEQPVPAGEPAAS